MKKAWFTIVLFSTGLISGLGQEPAENLFSKATDAYNEGEYQTAVALYDSILQGDIHSAALYFNLGNAHYKLGQIAPSIYFYEKALLLDPDDSEILNNLGFAQNMTLDDIQPMPQTDMRRAYESILHLFTMDQWAYIGVILMFLFVLGAISYYLMVRPNRKRISLIGALAALFFALAATALAYMNYREYRNDQPAIIFSESLAIREEPNPRSESVFELHEGTKVQVLDSLDTWVKLRIADGQTGWAQAKSMRLLKDF